MAEPITFKSVGQKAADRSTERTTTRPDRAPVGIKTPIRLGTKGDAIFAMNTTLIDQLDDNLRNLVLTNHGERVGLYNFGANLRPLMTEITAREDFEVEAMARIRTAVSRFMPFIKLKTFSTEIQNDQNANVGRILLSITYDVPQADVTGRKIDVVLHVI